VLNDPVQHSQQSSKSITVDRQASEDPSTNYNTSAPAVSESIPTISEETTLTTESAAPNDLNNSDNGMNVGPVLVRVKETGDALHDRYRVEDIMKLFAEFPGSDLAILEIDTGEKIVRLEMPFTVQSGLRLTGRLQDLLGTGSVRTAVV
jgi:hypothetical protein